MPASAIEVIIDKDADAAYIKLSDVSVSRTVQVTDDVLIDVDQHDVVVGVEVLRLDPEGPFTQLCADFHGQPVERMGRARECGL